MSLARSVLYYVSRYEIFAEPFIRVNTPPGLKRKEVISINGLGKYCIMSHIERRLADHLCVGFVSSQQFVVLCLKI